MWKRLFVIGSFIVLFVGFFSLVSFIGKSSVVANNSSIILNKQSWQIHFTNPLKASSLKDDRVILKDKDGNVVPITFTVSDDRKMITIEPPDNGFNVGKDKYVLHLSKKIKSFMGLSISGDNEFTISVVDALPTVESDKQLRKLLLVDESSNRMFSTTKMESSSEDKASNESGGQFSETNTQVAGIDEADTVKTDGTYIYSFHHEKIMIVEANGLKMVSSIDFGSSYYPIEFFIEEKKLIVIGYEQNYMEVESKKTVSVSSEDKIGIMPNSLTKIRVYDLTDTQDPKLVKEVGVEGNYYTSRKKDSFVYVIVNQHPFNGWIPEGETSLIPKMYDDKKGIYEQDLKQIQYIPQAKKSNFIHLLSIDIASSDYDFQIETILGGGDNVYMSKEHLYIASTKYSSEQVSNFISADTEIYKFHIDGLKLSFSGLGNVEGHTLNQFSMDEYEGHLRIATTENDETSTANSLYILDETMKVVGKLKGLAKDEQIYSVRFMGDKAYIVTFKEIDPLFVIDVSAPSNPKVLGELKIPGYSTYLHPIDEYHLIGFGYDTELVSNGVSEPFVRNKGMKISLFDITDFQNPKEKDTVIIGGEGTYSPIQYDHKALFIHNERSLYGFPISVYSSAKHSHEFTGALVYNISPSGGIKLKANIVAFSEGEQDKWDMEMSRLLYVNDDLITISLKEINAYSLNDFQLKNSLKLPVTY